jgi:hypothetical protein
MEASAVERAQFSLMGVAERRRRSLLRRELLWLLPGLLARLDGGDPVVAARAARRAEGEIAVITRCLQIR